MYSHNIYIFAFSITFDIFMTQKTTVHNQNEHAIYTSGPTEINNISEINMNRVSQSAQRFTLI